MYNWELLLEFYNHLTGLFIHLMMGPLVPVVSALLRQRFLPVGAFPAPSAGSLPW